MLEDDVERRHCNHDILLGTPVQTMKRDFDQGSISMLQQRNLSLGRILLDLMGPLAT